MPESRAFSGIDFGFRAGSSTALYHTSIRNGTFNVCVDTGDLYIDINNQRIATKDIISMGREVDILALQNPYQRIYYAQDTYNLWRYDLISASWKQVAGEHVRFSDKAERDSNGNVFADFYQSKTAANTQYSILNEKIELIDDIIDNINSFNILIVSSFNDLPAIGDRHTIYFVPQAEGDEDTVYDEYVWIDEESYYEKIGISTADLSNYYKKTEIDNILLSYYKKSDTYTKTEIDNKLNMKAASTHTHNIFTYATSTANGEAGFVPGPTAAQYNYVLTGHGWDTTAGTAQYAANAGSADYSNNAGTASYSNKTGTAAYSNKAGTATHASTAEYSNQAGSSDYASQAGTATYGTNAGTATYAVNAGTATQATKATNAGSATYATNAGTAVQADHATNADTATYANSAGKATNDSANQQINTTYIKNIDVDGVDIIVTKGNNSTYTKTVVASTYGNMTPATTTAAGKAGLVPGPTAAQYNYVLTGHGWVAKAPNASTADYATNAGTAASAIKDSAGQNINTTYLKNASVSGKVVTFTKGDGSTFSITTQDNNTTYANMTAATTAAAGKAGLVPAPTAAQYNYVLTGHGWVAKAPNASTADYATNAGTATYGTNAGTAIHASTADYATNAGTVVYASNAGTATKATNAGTATYANSAGKATQDSAGQQINTTYIKNASVSGRAITFTKGDGSTFSFNTQDNNTTYANMTAATTAADGAAGLVPKPTKEQYDYVLTGHGWAVNDGTFTYAKNAGTAIQSNHAINADTATYANSAGAVAWGNVSGKPSTYTAGAGTATYANNSGTAAYATNTGTATHASTADYATAANKATNDSANQQINTTYIKNASVNGRVVTFTKGNGSTFSITTQDTNTTYSIPTDYVSTAVADGSGATQGVKFTLKDGSTFKVSLPNTDTNTTYAAMTAATTATDGAAGLVPKPTKTQVNYVLSGAGWVAKATNAANADTATYAITAGSANAVSWANVSGKPSTYTAGAGTAAYATKSGTATNATNADTATYATNAGTANSVAWSNVSGKPSTYTAGAGTATYANNSGTAAYGTKSGTATYATNSGTATRATNASTADYATNAGTAIYSTNAGTAAHATNASTADYATLAGAVAWNNVSGKPSTYTAGAGTATYFGGVGDATNSVIDNTLVDFGDEG